MGSRNLTSALLGVLLVAVLGVTHKQCQKNKVLVGDIKALKDYEREAKYYKDENGKVIAYNNTLEVSLKALETERASLAERLKEMKIKKPEIVVVTNIVTKVDSIRIPFETKLPCDPFEVSFLHRDSIWIKIQGRVDNNGVYIDNVQMENEILWVLGEKKNGFLRRNEHVVSIDMSNPYVKVTTIEPLIIKQKPAFYDRLWFKGLIFVGGVATGVAVSR